MNEEVEIPEDDEEVISEPSTLRDELTSALQEAKERQEVAAEPVEATEKPQKQRDETGKFAKKEPATAEIAPTAEQKEPVKSFNAPTSWMPELKAKWHALPPDIQAEVTRREEDVQKQLTRMDEERNFGKQLKEIGAPYMPMITAEGGTLAGAYKDLLNTSYLLRTASPQEKGRMLWQIAQQFGADMSQNSPTASYVDPQLQQVQTELHSLKSQWQQRENTQKQQQQEAIDSEINAFKSDPAHPHFESVKAHMAALLTNGLAADMKDAYEQAVYASPDIRSTILAEQQAQAEARRVAEIKAKSNAARNASLSIRGAPGGAVPTAKAPDRPLREELKANYRAALGN